MKKLLLVIFISVTALVAHAQSVNNTNAFSVGLDVGFPSNSIYNIGFGGSGKAEVPLATALSLSVTAGYTSFYYKSTFSNGTNSQEAAGYVPLKAGVKYFFSDAFYVEGDAGTVIETNYSKSKLFAFSVGPGFIIATGKHTGVDFGFRYENWGSGRLRQTGLRVAYRFGW